MVFEAAVDRWTPRTRTLGFWSAVLVAAIGILYLAVITSWLVLEKEPAEPIGDPYLLLMEILTIFSAVGIVGMLVGLYGFVGKIGQPYTLFALISGALGAGLTMAVHFVQLTAVRQLWQSGLLPDYRLVWPSTIFAVEYFAWDVLFGLTMSFGGIALLRRETGKPAGIAFIIGGCLCLAGTSGPLSGNMHLQNLAVAGYGVVLPVAAAMLGLVFRSASPHSSLASP